MANISIDGNEKTPDVDIDAQIQIHVAKKKQAQLEEIMILTRIGLVQYYENFIENGYDCMEFMQEIKDEGGLMEIGINNGHHRSLILSEIDMYRMYTDRIMSLWRHIRYVEK